jgi:hypothetical protein
MTFLRAVGSETLFLYSLLVPTLCVGMPSSTLCVAKPATQEDAERPGRHSHAERL